MTVKSILRDAGGKKHLMLEVENIHFRAAYLLKYAMICSYIFLLLLKRYIKVMRYYVQRMDFLLISVILNAVIKRLYTQLFHFFYLFSLILEALFRSVIIKHLGLIKRYI